MGDLQTPEQRTGWRAWLGWGLLALGAADRIIGWGGNLDFLISRWSDPGWVGVTLGFIARNSGYFSFALIMAGVFFIVWNERRRTESLLARSLAATPSAVAAPAPAVSSPEAIAAERATAREAMEALRGFIWMNLERFKLAGDVIQSPPLSMRFDEVMRLRDEIVRMRGETQHRLQLHGPSLRVAGLDLDYLLDRLAGLSSATDKLLNHVQEHGEDDGIHDFRSRAKLAWQQFGQAYDKAMADIERAKVKLSD